MTETKSARNPELFTPFSTWIRQLPPPLDSKHMAVQDVDFICYHYHENAGWFISLEEKQHGAEPDWSQKDTSDMIAQILAAGSGEVIRTVRGRKPIHYRGHYLVVFQKTSPDDSEWVKINDVEYKRPSEAVTRLLSTGSPTGVYAPQLRVARTITKHDVYEWLKQQTWATLVLLIKYATTLLEGLAFGEKDEGETQHKAA